MVMKDYKILYTVQIFPKLNIAQLKQIGKMKQINCIKGRYSLFVPRITIPCSNSVKFSLTTLSEKWVNY